MPTEAGRAIQTRQVDLRLTVASRLFLPGLLVTTSGRRSAEDPKVTTVLVDHPARADARATHVLFEGKQLTSSRHGVLAERYPGDASRWARR